MVTVLRKLNLAAAGMLVCLAAGAQDVPQSELAECASQPTAAEKLACYEALTVISAPAPAQPVSESPDLPAEATMEAEASVPATAVADEPPAEAPPAPAQPASAAVDSRPSVPDDLGQEQLGIKEEKVEPSPVTAVVSEVTQSDSGRLYFHFSNGQVWRQIEPRRFQYPKDQEFEVTVSQGMMGEYRMRIGEKGRMVRIRRVQ